MCYSLILIIYFFIADTPRLTLRPSDTTITEGNNATFHCIATGNPTPQITWTKDGKAVSTGETLSFVTDRNQSGEYWCLAENGLNLTVNASAILDVQCEYYNRYYVMPLNFVLLSSDLNVQQAMVWDCLSMLVQNMQFESSVMVFCRIYLNT